MDICYIGYQASRYRDAIFRAIDKEFNCDWYFGMPKNDIKNMDLSLLKKVHRFRSFGNPSRIYWKVIVHILLFKKKNYDAYLILGESRCLSDYVFIGLSKLLGRNVYIWTHGLYGKESTLELKLKCWQFNHSEGVFVYSNYSRNLMIENGISENKVHTIHNSLDYETQKNLRECLKPSTIYLDHFGNNNQTIVFVGRLTPVKRLDMIIDAVAELNKTGNNYNLVFVGDGIEGDKLKAKVNDLGINSQVWFYGACYDEKTNAEMILNADLCVAPGNVGLTAMHTMMFGCPVITHNDFKWQMPEFEAIRIGETGDFFERNNLQSLVSAISNWFNSPAYNRERIREACYNEIDMRWNPSFQIDVLKKYIK